MTENNRNFLFVAGLHRSGTSLLHEILRGHPDISGISGSGVPQDEGQHLQTVFPNARSFGGPGKFAFDRRSYMDESHLLATRENADELFRQWSKYLDLSKRYLVEKSPPTIIRTRFFQKLYPQCKFVVILRHPVAVAYATQKMSKTSIRSLIDHSLRAYEIFFQDREYLDSLYVMRYEDFVNNPRQVMQDLFAFLDLAPQEIVHSVRKNVNEKYFNAYDNDRGKIIYRLFNRITPSFEARANRFGYSLGNPDNLLDIAWSGSHRRSG